MAAVAVDISSVQPFDVSGAASSLATKWRRWLKSFEIYVAAKAVVNAEQKKALLLHCAGQGVQEVFDTLADPGPIPPLQENEEDPANAYQIAVRTLNAYFTPKTNESYERHIFRSIEQKEGETVDKFVSRLKSQAVLCNFPDDDIAIRDQVVDKCRSNKLKRKLLEIGELTLDRAMTSARVQESIDRQMETLAINNHKEAVNAVQKQNYSRRNGKSKENKRHNKTRSDTKKPARNECYRCGQTGHYGRDENCPARGKKCSKCNGDNHFAKVCRSKRHRVNQVDDRAKADSDSDEFEFMVQPREKQKTNTLQFKVGGVCVDMLVDSGATANLIDEETWKYLKKHKVKCHSHEASPTKKLYTYSSDKPLTLKGKFKADIAIKDRVIVAEVLVIQGQGLPLLGSETAKKLGVLQVGPDINAVTSKSPDENLQAMVNEFKKKKLFDGLGKVKGRQIQLKVNPDIKPVAQPVRRIPFGIRKKVEEKIQEMIDMDVIEPVEEPTPWVSPIVVVPKKSGDIRLCVDMRRVNEAIERERHPIPTMEDVLQDMSRSNKFSKLDLKWGYHQLELSPESRKLMTFVTHTGLYRYKRLPFGVNAASEIYQHEIHKIIQGIPGVANISDDVLIHGIDEQHDDRLFQVLTRLHKAGATLNLRKCLVGTNELEFFGHQLSDKGLDITQGKVEAIVNAEKPSNASEVRSFLGLITFCSRFVPNLSTLADPLRKLTRKNQPFKFGEVEQQAFEALKQALSKAETLAYFDVNAKTMVMADASPIGLGAILIQKQDGIPRVVSYASRSLSAVERRYSQTEKEALGLVWACEKFHPYIYGVEFDLLTDHKPLQFIYSPRSKPCARIERWMLRLQPYRYRVVHIPGIKNVADPLSRLVKENSTDEHSRLQEQTEGYIRYIAVNATPNAVTTREVEQASRDDDELKAVREGIRTGKWDNCNKLYSAVANELCIIGKLVLRGTRIVVPKKLRPRILALAHEGHLGIVGTKQALRLKVWWPGLERDAERHCKSCHGCQITSRPNAPEPIRSTSLPSEPWEDIAMDFLGPLPNGESVLVIIDYYSRYYEFEIMKTTTAEKTISVLSKVFARHGLPVTVSSDNGPQFISKEFAAYMKESGIKHHLVTPKWPQANGEVERQNASLVKRMKIAQAEGGDWKTEILKYVAQYRAKPHPCTRKSPGELLFGRRIRTKLPELRHGSGDDTDVRDRDAEQKGISKLYADTRRQAKEADIMIGDSVLVKREKQDKMDSTFKPSPFQVIDKQGSKVTVESPDGALYDRNVSWVKRYNEPQDTEPEPENNASEEPSITTGSIEPETTESPSTLTQHPTEKLPPVSPRRSTRDRKTPSRYNDFVVDW